jgi:hypothetical protein
VVDERLDILLRGLEWAPEPEPAFAEQLYRQLAAKAGFGTVRGSSWRERMRRATWVVGGPLRLAWLALLILLIVLAMLGYLIAGGAKPRPYAGLKTAAPSSTPAALTSPTPRDTRVPVERPLSGVLTVGEPAPAWSASLLDGGNLRSTDLAGRPAAVYLWCGCAPGPEPREFAAEASARHGQMTFVLASLDDRGTTRGLVDWLDFRGAVIGDSNQLLQAWDLSYFPALVLFRGDGSVADLQPANFSPAKLSAILDALLNEGTIPDPDPWPSPPADEDSLSSVLDIGQPAPELRGPGLEGEEHSTLELIGRPAVVLHLYPPDAAGRPRDDGPRTDRLIAELDARAGSVNGLLIAHGERSTGDVAAYLAARGSELPVIFDWSGELFERWGLVYWPTLVGLDADGRVAALGDKGAVSDPTPFIDALLTPGPSQASPSANADEDPSPN